MGNADADDEVDGERGSLDDLVKRGLGWSFVNTVITRGGTFFAGVAIARLVSKSDYGVFAVALLATTAILSLNDIGVSAAIVRWPGDIREIAATASTLVFAGSAVLFVVLFVAAPPIARFLNVASSVGVLRLLAFGVVLDALFAVPAVALTRSFQQKRRAFADAIGLVVWATISIGLAALGFGAWGLVWGRLAGTIAGGIVILILSPMRVLPGFDRRVARELVRFGIPLAGSSFLTFAVLNTDYVIVGHVLGAVPLGLYYLAFNLSSWPVNTISFTVRRVSLAGFSRLQHDENEMREGFIRAARLLSLAAFPICALLASLAVPLVHVVYGAKWSASAAPLRWLAVLGAIRVIAELGYDYLVAAGRPRLTVVQQLFWFVALVPALIVGAHSNGIVGVGTGHVLVAVVIVLPVTLLALRSTGLRLNAAVGALVPALALGALTAGVATLGVNVTKNTLGGLAIGGTAGTLCALSVVLLARRGLSVRARSGTAVAAQAQPQGDVIATASPLDKL